MNKNLHGLKKGFTLLEMLLVIAIIAILAGIVIVAINPARQIAQANNAQRRSDVLAVLNAVHQYGIDNRGVITALGISSIADAADDCQTAGDIICIGDVASGCDINLADYLASTTSATYISAIPVDPSATSTVATDYRIAQDSTTNRLTVCAPEAELSEEIEVTR